MPIMKFIAHRGLWHSSDEKNSLGALKAAIDKGFGIETDIRDYRGNLVISHDVADSSSPDVESFFTYYHNKKSDVILALNVKADGIQKLLMPLLNKYGITNYFLFDMSIPEYVVNVRMGLSSFTRHSDIETECVMYDQAKGVWMDSFYQDNWFSVDAVKQHLVNNKNVCIVSPELHKKTYDVTWSLLRENLKYLTDKVYLCTDIPETAEEFFNGCQD